MVAAPPDGQPNADAVWFFQVGYIKRPGTEQTVRWGQWTKSCYPNCSGANHGNWYGSTITGKHTYAVYLVAATQRLRATIDGGTVPDGPAYNPAAYWDAAWSAEYSSEVQDETSNLPGVLTNKVKYSQIQRYNGDGTISYVAQFQQSAVKCELPPCGGHHYETYDPGSGLGFRTWTG